MKKAIGILTAIIISITMGIPVNAQPNKNYLALGDSITSGYGLGDMEESFPSIVGQGLGMKVENKGVDGYTSEDLLALVKQEKIQQSIKSADLITITTGGNDLLKTLMKVVKKVANLPENPVFTDFQQALINIDELVPKLQKEFAKPETKALFDKAIEEFSENLDEIIAIIKELNPNSQLVIQTLYNPFSGAPVFYKLQNYSNEIIDSLNNAIKSKEGDFLISDTGKAFTGRGIKFTNILYLDIHPNKSGHRMIGSLIIQGLG